MRFFTALAAASLLVLQTTAHAQITPPKPGVELPRPYFERIRDDESAFRFRNAWIQKAERVRKNREQFFAGLGHHPMQFSSLSDEALRSIAVSGAISVPVFMAKYSNTGPAPYPVADLQQELFDGPWPTGTMAELYSEMSNGLLNLAGTVHDWVTLSQSDTYYEGGCNGLCGTAKTGQFILEILSQVDPGVDFGQYDNDGPDGIPNSGDDDGYVDFVAFVHPEIGGECLTSNMWSHRWVVQAWPEFSAPWQTDDARTGGGNIEIQDYTIQPAVGCGGTMIEIGVFSHEFGHAFGLPDLYDRDGGGFGIGVHGLMGSGNWNTPTNPAHMSAWSKVQLGWALPIDVGPIAQTYAIDNVNQTNQVYRLAIMEEKFTRKSFNAISGSYSLHCGLTDAEANGRNWPGGGGFGNKWDEEVRRDFSYDGTTPVTLQYDASYDMQLGFDFVRMQIKVNGTVTSVKTHTGTGSETGVTVDLTPYLSGSGATTYQIIALFHSGSSKSDEDGDFNSGSGGPFILDNISVTGGGETYFTDFEQAEDGWHTDFGENPTREFFLLENRNKAGQFDQGLAEEGLFIWHIEQNVVESTLGNTGGGSGTTNLLPAGVMLEETDGLRQLLLGVNSGDAGDVCPGTSGSRAFDGNTTPSSVSHNGVTTNVLVDDVSNPGPQMTATMRAGHLPPSIVSITPASGDQGSLVPISELAGGRFVHGATFLLRDGVTMTEYPATTASWTGKARLVGDLDLTGVPGGSYDVVVRNPDGQEAVLTDGFDVDATVPVFFRHLEVAWMGTSVELTWEVWTDEVVRAFRILRRDQKATTATSVSPVLIDANARRFVDEGAETGTAYEYRIVVILEDGSELSSPPVALEPATLAFALQQNDPNPFNPSTRIRFSLPSESHAGLVVYDLEGRRIATLVDETRAAGPNEVVWDGTSDSGDRVASGVYFYRLVIPKKAITKKLLILK